MPILDEPRDLALYFWPTPKDYSATILLEELGLAYRLFPVNVTQIDQHTDEQGRHLPTRKRLALRHRQSCNE